MSGFGREVGRTRVRQPRGYVFLTLLLLALLAPAGMVVADEATARYVVLFHHGAVSTADTSTRPALSGSISAHEPETPGRSDAPRSVDAARVMRHVQYLESRTGLGSVNDVYTSAVGGFAADLTPGQLQRISDDPAVSAVLPDEMVSLDPTLAADAAGGIRTTGNPNVRVPAGVRRVGARGAGGSGLTGRGQRVNADVAVIDTGVDPQHPDLNVVGGYNCTGRNRAKWDDNNGHGTHVAGIVGALDNSFGVTGVAPGARVWSVKVLDKRGYGYLSWVVCGVDWVTAQREKSGRPLIEVANMSLSFSLPGGDRGCGERSRDSLHLAICRSVDRGTVYVAAAGNEARDARRNRPAAYSEVITVSAMADYDGRGGGRGKSSDSCPYWTDEPDDGFASFSNYGSPVDLIAPGRCVLSTYTNRRYGWMSGTSMATPHVAGAAAVYRAQFPRATPQQVRLALQAVARLDWRTGTDRDRNHEKAVWIGQFRQMPDFRLRTTTPSGSVAPGGSLQLGVSLVRVGGFDEPVRVALDDGPRGISAPAISVAGPSGNLTVSVSRSVPPGRYGLSVVASSAGIERRATVYLSVQHVAAQATFTSPRGGASVQSNVHVDVAWNERYSGSITTRRLERESGRIETPGTCDGVRFTLEDARSVSGDGVQSVRGGRCYRWRLTLTDDAGQRSTAQSGAVLVDISAPRAPSVTLAAESAREPDLERIGVDQTHIGHSGMLWVRGGVSGRVMVNVDSFDPESGIAANVASVDTGRGWRATWLGSSSDGSLRLSYAARGGDARLYVSSINGARSEGPATVRTLLRDGEAPTAVRWTSLPADSTRHIRGSSFRLDWAGGSDEGAGLASAHVIGRYRAGLTPDGRCRTSSFKADGYFRLESNHVLESGLQPGSCYAWSVRTLDRVGNSARSAVSGYLITEPRR